MIMLLMDLEFMEMCIRDRINKKKNLQLIVFSKIKKLVDDSTCFDEIEYHLVFMNILLDKYYQPVSYTHLDVYKRQGRYDVFT